MNEVMAEITTRERLKMWRLHRGLTLQEVAEFAGRTKQLIGMMETGASSLVMDVVEEIVTKAFRITMLRFYGDPPEPVDVAAPARAPARKSRKAAA